MADELQNTATNTKPCSLARQLATMLPDERMAQWAIRWILDHPEVTTVIPGATKVTQVHSNMQASGLPSLPEEIHHRLRVLYDEEIRPMIRGHFNLVLPCSKCLTQSPYDHSSFILIFLNQASLP